MFFYEGDVGLRIVQKLIFSPTRLQDVPFIETDGPAGGRDAFEIHASGFRTVEYWDVRVIE